MDLNRPFSPCGRRWPEGPDEGSIVLSTRRGNFARLSEAVVDPSSVGFADTFSRKGRRDL
jgi:hypothetical protein